MKFERGYESGGEAVPAFEPMATGKLFSPFSKFLKSSHMDLVIDIGNSSIKTGLFDRGELMEVQRFGNVEALLAYAEANRFEAAAVCKVGHLSDTEQQHLLGIAPQVVLVDQGAKLPFSHQYETPGTLGMDRIAAVAGAVVLYPDEACLVVDMGSCITLDFVDKAGFYHGGRIAPGRQMRYKAMHHFTAALPLVEGEPLSTPVVGNSTKACMTSGVDWGIAAEIEGAIRDFREKFGFFNVIICGGDAKYFESRIKATIFVFQHLTLYGLKRILELNAR